MPETIEFSIMAPNADGIQPLLDQFEAETQIRVRLRLLDWDSAWKTLVKACLYNDAPDVSEIGTTWVGDLIGMNALRPYTAAEVAALGQAAAFLPAAWRTATQYGNTHVWSIPWLTGSRLVYYRPALLEQAGVDPTTAFQTNQSLAETVHRLAESGVEAPWTVPTGLTHTTLLNAASWVWSAGGKFLSADRMSTRFMQPEALAGLEAYFGLGRYLAPQVRHLNGLEPDTFFLTHPNTGMTISGPWLYWSTEGGEAGDESIAVALPPGASFVGGSNLVVWENARNPEAACKLVRFLTRPGVQSAYCLHVGLLPSRKEALDAPPFSDDPIWQTAARGLETGKSFPNIRLWGLVEDRLMTGLAAVWADLLSNPELTAAEALATHLGPLSRRLDALLGQG